VGLIPKLHKIPVQNVKKLQKFAKIINRYVFDKPIPTLTTLTTSPLTDCQFCDSCDKTLRHNRNRRKPVSLSLKTNNQLPFTVLAQYATIIL